MRELVQYIHTSLCSLNIVRPICKGVAPSSNDNNMCVSFYTIMSTHYSICNFQIVDIYQNIRPPTKKPSEN